MTASALQFNEAFLDSIAPVKALFSGVFQRLKLKDDPFQVLLAATDTEVEELWNNILTVESTLTQKDTTKKSLSSKKKLQEFPEHRCCAQHYSFAIKVWTIQLYNLQSCSNASGGVHKHSFSP